MVDQIFRSMHVISVIKKLDAHVSVDSENPIAYLMNLMEQCSVFYTEHKT